MCIISPEGFDVGGKRPDKQTTEKALHPPMPMWHWTHNLGGGVVADNNVVWAVSAQLVDLNDKMERIAQILETLVKEMD